MFGVDIATGGADVDIQPERRMCLEEPCRSELGWMHRSASASETRGKDSDWILAE